VKALIRVFKKFLISFKMRELLIRERLLLWWFNVSVRKIDFNQDDIDLFLKVVLVVFNNVSNFIFDTHL
jgi:hypothetical protein